MMRPMMQGARKSLGVGRKLAAVGSVGRKRIPGSNDVLNRSGERMNYKLRRNSGAMRIGAAGAGVIGVSNIGGSSSGSSGLNPRSSGGMTG